MGLFGSLFNGILDVAQRSDEIVDAVNKGKELANKIADKIAEKRYKDLCKTCDNISNILETIEHNFDVLTARMNKRNTIVSEENLVSYKYLIPPKYDDIFYASNEYISAKINGKYGIVDKEDNVVIPFEYDYIGRFGNRLFPAKINEKMGYINLKNEIAIEFKYEYVGEFSGDLAVACVEVEGDLKYGYINMNGEFVINPKYDDAYEFNSDGLAKVGINKFQDCMYGVIDKNDTSIVNCNYQELDIHKDFIRMREDSYGGIADFVDLKGFPIELEGQAFIDFFDKRGFKEREAYGHDIEPKLKSNQIVSYGICEENSEQFTYGFRTYVDNKNICKIKPVFEEAYGLYDDNTAIVKRKSLYGIIKIEESEV